MATTVARVTLILRDIPKDVPEEEIKQLFQGDNVQKVHPDIGNTWFVTFDTEEDCLAAYEKCQLKCWRDEPLKVRIKSENVLNRFLPVDSPAFTSPPNVASSGFPAGGPMSAPYPPYMPGMFPAMPFGPPAGIPPFSHLHGRPYPGFMVTPGLPPHVAAALNMPAAGERGKGKGRGHWEAEALGQPKGYEGPVTRYRKDEIVALLSNLMTLEAGKVRPPLPDLPCISPVQIQDLELCPQWSAIMEVTVDPKDLKTTEKTYSRGSGRKTHLLG